MIKVKATREGLVGHKTATGYIIDKVVNFVALPSVDAKGLHIYIHNPVNGKSTIAQVLDVGPWNTHDNNYVFQFDTSKLEDSHKYIESKKFRPMAESGLHIDKNGQLVQGEINGAGIDLGEAVWNALGMTGNTEVEWEFI